MVSTIYTTVLIASLTIGAIMGILVYVLNALGYMKCMQKAGEATWKAWVPFYNDFTMYKIVGLKSFLVIFKVISAIITVIYLIVYFGIVGQMLNDADDIINNASSSYYSTNNSTLNKKSNSAYYNNSYKRPTTSAKYDEELDEIMDSYLGKTAGIMILSVVDSLLGIGIFVINIFFAIKISKAYGLGGGYIAGMILLPTIFILIIGFGKSQYKGDYKPVASTVM